MSNRTRLDISGLEVAATNPMPTKDTGDTAVAGKTVVTTHGTPVSLGTQAINGVTIIANTANTGNAYVYPVTGAKTDVVPLAKGDSIYWPVANISALEVDVDVDGDSVYWQGAV